MSQPKTQIAAIRQFFGFREGDKLSDFSLELKALSDAEKLELAQGSARNLGWKQEEVNFPLT